MAKRITKGLDAGKKILDNWNDFNATFDKNISNKVVVYNVKFCKQEGKMSINYNGDDINSVNLVINDEVYTDNNNPKLKDVAKIIINK